MTKKVTKKVEPLFKVYETYTRFQLNDLFNDILNSTVISPAAFKIPMLAVVACVMKEPLPKPDGTPGPASNNPMDYYPGVAGILDRQGQLKPLLEQIKILRQAEVILEKAKQAQKEKLAKEAEERAALAEAKLTEPEVKSEELPPNENLAAVEAVPEPVETKNESQELPA